MDTQHRLSVNIRRLRQEKGLTQQQLGERLNVSSKTVSKWETGAGLPDVTQLSPLAEVLGVTVDELLNWAAPYPVDGEQRLTSLYKTVTETYGVGPDVIAAAAGTDRAAVERALIEGADWLPQREAGRLFATLELLSQQIPLYVDRPTAFLSGLMSRLSRDNALTTETAARYTGLDRARLEGFFAFTEELTPPELLRLALALVLLDRALNPTVPYPRTAGETEKAERFERLLRLGRSLLPALPPPPPGLPLSQVTVLEGSSLALYTTVNDTEGSVCERLEAAGETSVRRLVCLFADGRTDLPSAAFRRALLAWRIDCTTAQIQVDRDGPGTMYLSLGDSLANMNSVQGGVI